MFVSIQHTRVSSLIFLKYVRCGLESHIVSSITLSEALRSFAQTVRDYKFSDFENRETSDNISGDGNLNENKIIDTNIIDKKNCEKNLKKKIVDMASHNCLHQEF